MQQFNPQIGAMGMQQSPMGNMAPTMQPGQMPPTMTPQQSPTIPNLPQQGASPFGGFDPTKMAMMLAQGQKPQGTVPGMSDAMQGQWNAGLQNGTSFGDMTKLTSQMGNNSNFMGQLAPNMGIGY